MFRRLQLLFLISGLLWAAPNSWAAFTASTATFTAVDQGAVAWGDYDGDGDPDLLYAGDTGTAVVKLYRNDGGSTPTMTDVTSTALAGITGVRSASVAWGDFNNDGRLDFAVAGLTDANTRLLKIFRNVNGSSFTEFANLTGVEQGAIAWADINGTGYQSLIVCGTTTGTAAGVTLQIYRNNSGASFTAMNPGLNANVRNADLAVADMNLDGHVDFVIMGSDASNNTMLKVFRNNGAGVFTEFQSLSGYDQGGLAVGDVNGDGYPDLAVQGTTVFNNFNLRVHINNASGSLETTASISLLGFKDGRVAFGDADNDGDLDLAVTGNQSGTKTTKVYVNTSNSYSETGSNITLTGAANATGALAWADVDNDGDLDLFVIGDTTFMAALYKNDAGLNAAPTVPSSGFSSTMVGGILTLQWGNGSDNNTPVSSLMYQLRVGTSSGGSQASTSVYGTPLFGSHYPARLSPSQPGRVFFSFPSNAIIYWSVRTIDNGLKTSSWSSEQAFYTGGALTVSGAQGAHVNKGKETSLKSGVIKDPSGNLVSGAPVQFTVTKPNGDVLTYTSKTDSTGVAKATVSSDETTQPGIYSVIIEGSNISIPRQTVTFVVAVEDKPEITVAPKPFTPTKPPYDKAGFIARDRNDLPVELKVFEIGGALIRKISFGSGENVEWNGRDEAGNVVEGGIYLWQMTFTGKNLTGTVVVAR